MLSRHPLVAKPSPPFNQSFFTKNGGRIGRHCLNHILID
jgi:hypothetical protein